MTGGPAATGPGAADAAARLREAGQAHLVDHAAGLEPRRRDAFLAEAAAEPWDEVAAALAAPAAGPPPLLRPPEALTLRRQRNEPGYPRRLADLGRGFLAGGRVAALLLAGGQGTRLGHPGPKGTFVFGPEPDRSLYAILLERVARAGRDAGRPVPLAVLVSRDTEAATRAALEGAAFHGLEPARVHLVRQAELPAVDDAGRALLSAPGVLAKAPDGHGGALGALAAAGLLDAWAAEGVDAVVTFQVDNPLARPLDPVFLGWMLERHASAIGKAVRVRSPDEKVGLFARDAEGRLRVVEYSERPAGGLAPEIVLGSIAVNAFALRFLRETVASGTRLPLHRARKRVPHLGPDGGRVEPDAPNAWKLERFLFDLFPLAPRATVHEVDRRREFAPVKDAAGEDSPETARATVAEEVRRWHRSAGAPAPASPSLRPLVADGPDDLRAAPGCGPTPPGPI